MNSFASRDARQAPLDLQRGLIMVVMALDHCSFFLGKTHWLEFWGIPLSLYPSEFAFLTRWVTHFCAPGFAFLMGASLALLASSRQRAGWTHRQVRWFLVKRGLLLLLLQQVLENPVWLLGLLSGPANHQVSSPPGSGDPMLFFAVLYALGGSMIVSAFLLRLPVRWLALLGLVGVGVTFAVITRATPSTLYAPVLRLLIIPGINGVWQVNYPLLPWLGITLLGVAFGRVLERNPLQARDLALYAGVGFLLAFAVMRALNWGDFHPAGAGWVGFLSVTKYPPSPAFVALTLGVHGLLWWVFNSVSGFSQQGVVSTIGSVPLFFYIAHLYLFMGLGWLFRQPASLPVIYAVWLAGVLFLYPLCRWYLGFKRSQPVSSVWRLF